MSEPNLETIQGRVLRVIATTKRIPLENVRPDSTFEELGVDSLDRLNILFDLESEFDIEINDEDAKRVSNIDEMVQGITLLVDAKAAGLPPESLLAATPAAHGEPAPGASPAAGAGASAVTTEPPAESTDEQASPGSVGAKA